MVNLRAAGVLLVASLAAASPAADRSSAKLAERDTGSFVDDERPIALAGMLANIGTKGALSTNASRGIVIAGPGVLNPDYRYSWTRDSAMTLKVLVQEFVLGNKDLEEIIGDYVHGEAVRQTVYNPMGPLYPWGTGLAEAKFNINTTRYNGVWGRPQRDGPALRAITMMDYINWLIINGQTEKAKTIVWPVVQNDLNYVGQYWNQTGYDLWEEVAGSSFFTIISSWRALVQGQHIAHRLGETCLGCVEQQPNIACFVRNYFWNATKGYIVSDINGGSYRSGINANYLIGATEIFDIRGACNPLAFQPCSSYILASHKVYVDSFRKIYTLNANASAHAAIATGRYPEDNYYGGNPWYLCTLAAAEVLYDAAAQFRFQGKIVVDQYSLAFFKDIYPDIQQTTYMAPASAKAGLYGDSADGDVTWGSPARFAAGDDNEFTKIIQAMTTYADGFVDVVETYTPANGSLSEQYQRDTGYPLSAYDLTWSFASFVSMAQRRAGQFPASWNSRVNKGIAKKCIASSTIGEYAPAIAAGAPAVDMSCTVQVTFMVHAETTFGTNIYVAGNQPAMGNYEPGYAPMVPPNYPIWQYIVDLPPSTEINYKYSIQGADSYNLEWLNRTITTPACGNGRVQISTNDTIGPANITITAGFCNPDVIHCW